MPASRHDHLLNVAAAKVVATKLHELSAQVNRLATQNVRGGMELQVILATMQDQAELVLKRLTTPGPPVDPDQTVETPVLARKAP